MQNSIRNMTYNFLKYIDNTWTLFLDRDGVINKRIWGGYVTKPSEYIFLPGVLASISVFSSIFNRIIIVTNQQGIGKGIMTEEELQVVHDYMTKEINLAGGSIDGIYYCPELTNNANSCRKPSTSMAQKAVDDFPDIDLSKSIMVGDSPSDIEFGNNAGMYTVFIKHENDKNSSVVSADIILKSLPELKTLIQKKKL